LEDLKFHLSKTLNTSLFAKRLEFFCEKNKAQQRIDPLKPFGEQGDVIDFGTKEIEIEVKIEHFGA